MKKITKVQQIKQTEDFLKFLKKRIESKNFKNNVSVEEFEKTKAKYEKTKLQLKYLTETK